MPPTYAPTLSFSQKIRTATAIATAYRWNPVAIQDSKGIAMVAAPPGCFLMGDAAMSDAKPVSEICFDKTVWFDKFEVTNEAFQRFKEIANGYKSDANWTDEGKRRRDEDQRQPRGQRPPEQRPQAEQPPAREVIRGIFIGLSDMFRDNPTDDSCKTTSEGRD